MADSRNVIHESLRDTDVMNVLVEGLITDECHHKQWYIEQALLKLGANLDELRVELERDDYGWEDGIVP